MEIKFDYTLDKNSAAKALVKRYFAVNLKKCIVRASLLGILALLFALAFFIKGTTAAIWLAAVDLIAIASIFYSPYSSAKSIAARYENGITYKFALYENGFSVTPPSNEEEIREFDKIVLAEQIGDYLFIDLRERFYPVILPEDGKNLCEQLKNKLGDRFKQYDK